MNPLSESRSRSHARAEAFTRTDAIVALAVVFVLFTFCHHALGTRVTIRSNRIVCVNNLRQIGQAWRMSSTALNDKFPFQVLSLPPPGIDLAYRWYQVISNELRTSRILVCPSDPSHGYARDFSSLTQSGTSYWIGLDVGFDLPRTILGGDWNIQGGIPNGIYIDMPPQQASLVTWYLTIHNQQGNILNSDGSVHQYDNSGLQDALRTSGGQTNRVLRTN